MSAARELKATFRDTVNISRLFMYFSCVLESTNKELSQITKLWAGNGLEFNVESVKLVQITPNSVPNKAVQRSGDSAVGTATGYGLDDRGVGVRVPVGSRIFSSLRSPDRLSHPASYPMGTGGLFPRG
jgi:hypothetical protein